MFELNGSRNAQLEVEAFDVSVELGMEQIDDGAVCLSGFPCCSFGILLPRRTGFLMVPEGT